MKSKFLFCALAIIVFSILGVLGFQFFKSNTLLFYVVEVVALLALALFIILYVRLVKPYKIIASGMELLKEQDFSTRLRPMSDSEANKLISVFNKMIDTLKEERLQVREKNQFLDLLIQASPQGVIILDFDECITDINPAGLKLLNILEKNNVIGKRIKDTEINIRKSLAALEIAGSDIVVRETGMATYRCVRSSFIDKGFNHPFILIEELTDELLKIEKQSYERVIRMIAHEVNNSIGAIGATLNVISEIMNENKYSDFSDVLSAVDASSERCLHLGRFICNLAEVIKLPEPHKTKVDLNELSKSVKALTGIECCQRNINLRLCLSEQECIAYIDAIQMEQVLVNIVKNAYEAIGKSGEICITTSQEPLKLIVSNNGPEIPEQVARNLFIPFFSTKLSGQGIGLMVVREILRNHNVKFKLYSENGWTIFEITF